MASGGETIKEISKTDNKGTTQNSEKKVLIKTGHKRFFGLKVPSDKHTCDFVSACFIDDRCIILADKGNKNVKWLDTFSRGTIKNWCDLSDYPSQVCVVNEQKVAVTLPFSREVKLISLERGMRVTNKVKLDIMCRGIAFANRNYYISDMMGYIHIYALNGRKEGVIDVRQSIEEWDSNTNHLAVNNDASRIYIANGKQGLKVVDKTGKVVGMFNGPLLRNAQSCCLTGAGNVLVSGANSNNVVQLTSEGELIGEVVKSSEGSGGVYAVSCNEEMSKLCISRYSDDDLTLYYLNS